MIFFLNSIKSSEWCTSVFNSEQKNDIIIMFLIFFKIRQTDRITKCGDSLYLAIILILSGRKIWVKPRNINPTYKRYATTIAWVEYSIMTDIGLDIDTCTCVCVYYM